MGLKDKYHRPHEPEITDEAKAWVVSLACTKPKDHGLAAELWSISALARFVCEAAEGAGFARLANAGKSTVWRILDDNDIKPHKIRYYLEKRDPEFDRKMQEVLTVYRDVSLYTQGAVHDARPNPIYTVSVYNPRHPERTLLYRTIAEHFETWLELASAGQFDGQGDHHTPRAFVRQAFRKYLECGIFAHGFARARCDDCGHDYFVAFSCKGRGVCPSRNTRRMVETAAHLTDHVLPRLSVRQWVLSVPKRLRYFMQRDGAVLNMVLRIFLRVIAQSLSVHCPGAARVDRAALHIGAVVFLHRFSSSLNAHGHFHVCVVDGVFEVAAGEADAQATAPSVIFHLASGIDETTVAQVQADLRRRILRAFVGRGRGG